MGRESWMWRDLGGRPRHAGAGPALWLVPAVLTGILATGLLPARMAAAQADAVLLSLAAVLFLRAGWALGDVTGERQRDLGTSANTYYEPRRKAIREGGAVLGGIAGAMAWGATAWLILVSGIERGSPGSGLGVFQLAVVVGLLSGGVVGAVAGRVLGGAWELWHRRRRRARLAARRPVVEVSPS